MPALPAAGFLLLDEAAVYFFFGQDFGVEPGFFYGFVQVVEDLEDAAYEGFGFAGGRGGEGVEGFYGGADGLDDFHGGYVGGVVAGGYQAAAQGGAGVPGEEGFQVGRIRGSGYAPDGGGHAQDFFQAQGSFLAPPGCSRTAQSRTRAMF